MTYPSLGGGSDAGRGVELGSGLGEESWGWEAAAAKVWKAEEGAGW